MSMLLVSTFMSGMVPPPSTMVVNKTTIKVVVTRTFLVSSSNSRWRESA